MIWVGVLGSTTYGFIQVSQPVVRLILSFYCSRFFLTLPLDISIIHHLQMSYTNMRKRIQRKETRDSRMAIMPYLMVIIYFLFETIDHSLLSRPISIYSVYSVTIQLNDIITHFH